MFRALTIRGQAAAILWGYRQAATVTAWTVTKARTQGHPPVWTLRATVTRSSAFELRQTPLLFSAPRIKGFWVWPIIGPPRIERETLTATLGPPEQ